MRQIDPDKLRSVHAVSADANLKPLYYDRERCAVRPNLVFVRLDGSISFETNEIGLKGDPLDRRRRLVVVWGDSVVFGVDRGWPCLLDQFAPRYQFLNGGIDGDPYKNILRRASAFNRRYPVALNVLMLGWHPFAPSWWSPSQRAAAGNAEVREDLRRFLEDTPNTVLLTTPTALNPRILDSRLSTFAVEGNDEIIFRFFGDIDHEVEGQRQAFAHIIERNALTLHVCSELGIRVVDLFAAFDTQKVADFREHFIDVLHVRPRAYQLLAQTVYDGIKDLLDRPVTAPVEPT